MVAERVWMHDMRLTPSLQAFLSLHLPSVPISVPISTDAVPWTSMHSGACDGYGVLCVRHVPVQRGGWKRVAVGGVVNSCPQRGSERYRVG